MKPDPHGNLPCSCPECRAWREAIRQEGRDESKTRIASLEAELTETKQQAERQMKTCLEFRNSDLDRLGAIVAQRDELASLLRDWRKLDRPDRYHMGTLNEATDAALAMVKR